MKRHRYWSGRHVLITGGSSGIGLATTEHLLERGALVTVAALPDSALEKLRVRALPDLVIRATDVTDVDQVAAAVDAGRERHGTIRSLITCAGVTRPGHFDDLPETEFRRQMEVNYFGTLWSVRQALPDLRAHPGGSITCVASAAALLGVFGYSAYSPSKFAVRGLSETLRQECGPMGVSVTCVYPPDVDTPMLAAEQPFKPTELRALSSGTPLPAARVARALVKGTRKGQRIVVPGVATHVLRGAANVLPGALGKMIDRRIARAR